MKKFLILFFLTIPSVLYGQRDAAQLFEPALLKADIDTLISKLKTSHPTFSHYYQANKLESKIDKIKKTIDTPMSATDFYRMMQPIVCVDGHTSLIYNAEVYPNYPNPLFPFKIVIYDNTIYIKENLSDNKSISKGMIVEKINGVLSKDLIDNLTRYVPGERDVFKLKKLEKNFNYYYQIVYGAFPEFDIVVNKKEWKCKGANWSDIDEAKKPTFELRFYDKNIAYICKRKFFPPNEFIHFMDSAFHVIAEKPIEYLIIDNLIGGGLTDLSDTLMTYFTNKPFSSFEKKESKISSLTKDYVDSKKSNGYRKDGYFVQEFPPKSRDRKHRFTGTTYILTGPLSYSAATCFSASAKCYKTALLVGEESGQPLLSNGGMAHFILPTTKMTCVTSLERVYFPCNNKDTINGVQPDYEVEPSLDDLLNDKNYSLEYLLKMIRKK